MKNIKVLPAMALACVLLITACKKEGESSIACLPAGLDNGVIAFYPFSNGSLNDFSGNGNHLTNGTTAAATADRAGNTNCAYRFANSTASSPEFLTRTNPTFLNSLTAISISLWYQPNDSTRDGGDYEVLVGRDRGTRCPDRRGQWSVGLFDCRRAVFGHHSSVWEDAITGSCDDHVKARTGTWAHLVATYTAANHEMRIYRNGILQESKQGIADCGSTAVTVQDIGELFIGDLYTGRLDDVIIYNRPLSQAEVSDLYGVQPCCLE